MVQTLESLLGTRMDHVVMVDFEGFIKLTESLGGVTVKNKNAFSSHGFDYPKGEITIAGEEALWFVRERKSLPNGDLDRAENQRMVIKAIVAKGLSPEIVANPTAFTGFISGVAEHVTVDSESQRPDDPGPGPLAAADLVRHPPAAGPDLRLRHLPGRPVDRHRRRGSARGPRQGDEEGHHGRVPGEVRRPVTALLGSSGGVRP